MKEPFEPVIRAHGPTVMRVCLAVLAGRDGATADADDVWAETFLSALQAWPQLDADANVQAWLVRIAQRKAIDALRARARRPVTTASATDDAASHHRLGSGQDTAAADRRWERTGAGIWSAVAELPDRQREAIGYHYLGGLTHVQTAELTGSTPAAVRRAAADGLARLRARMQAGDSSELRNERRQT